MVHYATFSSPCASAFLVVERGAQACALWSSYGARQPPFQTVKNIHCLTIAWGITMPQAMVSHGGLLFVKICNCVGKLEPP